MYEEIANAIYDYHRVNGTVPTHVLLGVKEKERLLDDFSTDRRFSGYRIPNVAVTSIGNHELVYVDRPTCLFVGVLA